ncbi:MAG: hypothetical protein IJ767_02965 [Bacteroidaceae bacterium]|nr:hypothetical protein [Bacteroidaceae bacterium]
MEKEKRSDVHITNNFNGPIGQHINHVDTIIFQMPADGTFHIDVAEECQFREEPEKNKGG